MQDSSERIVWTDTIQPDAVGPIMRSGELAEAVIAAVAEDNPQGTVYVTDRGDYVHVHTLMDCRLTRDSLQRCLGRDFDLARLEIDMPSFAGRLRTSDGEFRWYYSH